MIARKSDTGRQKHRALALWCFCVLILSASHASADYIPDFGGADYYFASEDVTKLLVELRFNHTNDPSVLLAVPRAYIHFAGSLDTKNLRKLPDRFTTSSIHSFVWLPTMEAWIPAFERGISKLSSWERREGRASLEVRFLKPDFPGTLEGWRAGKYPPKPSTKGLPVAGLVAEEILPTGQVYYSSSSKGFPFSYIECPNQPRVQVWCSYVIRVCPSLQITASLADFRSHGGLPYALEQHQKLVRLVKSWVKDCGSADAR